MSIWRKCLVWMLFSAATAWAQVPVPDARQLLDQVRENQKRLEQVRESYTYHQTETVEDIDSKGAVKKTETEESTVIFVHNHPVTRLIRKNGRDLDEHEQKKADEAVRKQIDKAEHADTRKKEEDNGGISIGAMLNIVTLSVPRREIFRGRPTLIFEFTGRRDAKTHGLSEDISKKLQGTVWIDEKDREVARMEVHLVDNFHLTGGLLANVQKGSALYFEQAPVNGEIWLPVGLDAEFAARVLLVKGIHQRVHERMSAYQRFHTEATQQAPAKNQ